jgi:uncharacterized protein
MRIVLDTNSLLVCISRESKYRPIFDAYLSEKFDLLISNDILSEYLEKIEEKSSAEVSENIGNLLLTSINTIKVEIYFKWSIIEKDADDNKFVDCGLNGRADYLVTDDRHFKILKSIPFPLLKIIRTEDFLNEIVLNF